MGKSTTATLIAHLLSRAGIKVCLAGNIGRPMLDCEGENPDWWVIELSSYQISDLEAKPDIAVLLNISEEHIDWHQGIEHYKADKLKLAQLASDGQVIANFSDRVLSEGLKNCPGIAWFNKIGMWQAGKTSVFRQSDKTAQRRDSGYGLSTINQSHFAAPAALPGEHNMQNLAAALSVVDALGLDVPRLDEALLSFSGLPYRLQSLGERGGIRYINDSISTTPVSVSAALDTVGHQDVVLLLGGMDRGLDWSGFARDMLDRTPYAIITLPDNGQKIFDCLKAAGVEPEGDLHASAGLTEAVTLAKKLVPERGCILLSPGAPSFPHFQDFEDRGEQFRKLAGF
jgi:UDP-N-acetylmuramoylalanine--D-glutamate ligase